MIAYTQNETVGITELSKSLGSYIDKLTSNTLSKLAIIRRNKLEAVIVPIEEYERMKAASNYLEDLEISKMIEERVLNKTESISYLSIDELKDKLRAKGRDV